MSVLDTSAGSSASTPSPSLLAQALRYLAYTSDVGEAFRPIVHVNVVRSAYGISWGYVLGDVGYNGYQDYHLGVRGTELRRTMVERAVFQSFASMIFPAITIHEMVRLTKRHVFPRIQAGRYMRWGPTMCGLGVIPFLPFMYDHIVEVACERIFDYTWPIEKPTKPRTPAHH